MPALTRQHAAQSVLQTHLRVHLRVRLVDQHTLGRFGVGPALAQRSGQLGLQDVGELLGFERAHTRQRQGPGFTQVLHHTRCMAGQFVCAQIRGHMLQFVVEQLVQVQPAQAKQFFVMQLAALVFQMHLQPLAEKRTHRFAQEAGQLGERDDRGLLVGGHERRQQCESRRWRVRLAGPITTLDLLRRPPLFGIGQQTTARLKVSTAERLQRVHGGQALGRVFAPEQVNLIAQLRDQHRGRLFAVVAHASAAPAHVEHLPRRQERFEHELAVVVAARAVAGARHARQAHQVKVGTRAAARVVAVVHAQHAHRLERDRPHRHQRAKRHAASAKALLQPGGLQSFEPSRTGHGQGHGFGKTRFTASPHPIVQRLVERCQGIAVVVVTRLEQRREHGAAALGPLCGRGALCAGLPPVDQGLQQVRQRPGQFGIEPAHFRVRRHAQ